MRGATYGGAFGVEEQQGVRQLQVFRVGLDPAVVLQGAVVAPADERPGPVDPAARLAVGVRDEALGGQSGAAAPSVRRGGHGQVQFAREAHGHGLAEFVQDDDPVLVDRVAERRRLGGLVRFVQDGGDRQAAFALAVGDRQAHRGPGRQPSEQLGVRSGVQLRLGTHHQAERSGPGRVVRQLAQQLAGRRQDRGLVVRGEAQQSGAVRAGFRCREHCRRAVHEGGQQRPVAGGLVEVAAVHHPVGVGQAVVSHER
ncbi:hypothetical protein GCM10020000_12870 [Streptomyces olivoverticillatus]